MFRIILLISLILLALPWLQKAKDYAVGKARTVKETGEVVGEVVVKAVKHNKGEKE